MLHWTDGVLLPMINIETVELHSLMLDVCIKISFEAANSGAPIQKQRRLLAY